MPKRKYCKLNSVVNVIDRILSWQSKRISNESIKPPTTSNNSVNPKLSYYGTKKRVQSIGSCLKQPNFTFTHKKVVNIYIVYELKASSSNFSDPTLKNCLFSAVTLTKMQILINIGILVTELGSIEEEVFHFQMADLVRM